MGQGKRILWIDAVKIAALLIVLCNHAGLSLGWGTYFGGMFYVAVFFVLSGCTYRCEAEKPLRAVIGKRARRLLLPYFGFNAFLLLFFGGKAALTGQAFPWGRELLGILYSRSYLYADGQEGLMGDILNGPTWFLTGLFTALTGYEIAVRLAAGRRRVLLGILLGCIALALALQRLPVLLPWSLDTMFLHMALIGLGNFLGQGGMEKRYGWGGFLAVAAVFVLSALGAGTGNLSVRDYGTHPLLYVIAAAAGSAAVMLAFQWLERHLQPLVGAMAALGRHTVSILCLHLFVFMFVEGGMAVLGLGAETLPVKIAKVCAGYLPGAAVLLWERMRDRRRG